MLTYAAIELPLDSCAARPLWTIVTFASPKPIIKLSADSRRPPGRRRRANTACRACSSGRPGSGRAARGSRRSAGGPRRPSLRLPEIRFGRVAAARRRRRSVTARPSCPSLDGTSQSTMQRLRVNRGVVLSAGCSPAQLALPIDESTHPRLHIGLRDVRLSIRKSPLRGRQTELHNREWFSVVSRAWRAFGLQSLLR